MKKFTKLLKDKKWRWTAGGVMCLALAAGMFALGSGVAAEAVTLGGQEITLDLKNGVYEIDSYSELKALGSATSAETSQKTFKLVCDLEVEEEITSSAAGTFSGEFDGNGHLITFNSIHISDDPSDANDQAGGLLFGTVDGIVQNVLVEIADKDETVDLELANNRTIQKKGEISYSYTASSPKTDPAEIASITDEETIDGKQYKVETVTEEGTATTEYEAVGTGANSFGFICGKLASKGTLKQIGLFGTDDNTMDVSAKENVLSAYSKSVQSGSRTVTYKYEIKESTVEKELAANGGVSVSTSPYDGGDTTVEAGSSTATFGEDSHTIEVALTAEKKIDTDGETFKYTLTLENKNTAEGFCLTNDLTGWNVEKTGTTTEGFDVVNNQLIQAGKTVVLCKEGTATETVSFVPSGKWSSVVVSYEYDQTKTNRTDFVASDEEPLQEGTPITLSGSLFVGGIAGSSEGTIQEIKQTLNLKSTTDCTVGGIAGFAVADGLSDLYMLGKTNNSSLYIGDETIVPSGSASEKADAIPAGGANWQVLEKYIGSDGTVSVENAAELNWLVKDVKFTYAAPVDGKIAVSLNEKLTSKSLDYSIIYTARKNITDSVENKAYFSNAKIDLGNSGFYRLVNIAATDGYYHYEEIVDSDTINYPYSDEGPFTIDKNSCKVIRISVNPLEEIVELKFKPEISGTVYYLVNDTVSLPAMGGGMTKSAPLNADGIVRIPFLEENAQYRMVVVTEQGHIYPAVVSDTFSKDAKEALPKASISTFSYYNSDGKENPYRSIGEENVAFVAGKNITIYPYEGKESNYSFKYLFSEVAPEDGKWDVTESENIYLQNRYLGGQSEFDNLMEHDAIDYMGAGTIPKDLAGKEKVYLYVEISKKNYNSETYCYGPISIVASDELTVDVPAKDGSSVINGDVLQILGMPTGAMVEYVVEEEPLTSTPASWNIYDVTNGIVMNESIGSYVYARIKYNDSQYSEIFEFSFTFGGECAEPRITPNTGNATGNAETDKVNASSISSTTALTLSSRTKNSCVFYLVSDKKQSISIQRVDTVPSVVLNDGDCNAEKTARYFKVGTRWYRTDNVNVEKYTQSILLHNETAEPKLGYISAVAVADGYEISAVRNYVYSIKQAQQVANPEAAIETSFSPSEESHEVATVSRGANITFYSVTPETELYYAIGTGTEAPETKMPESGITVDGQYGERFVVRVQAKREGMISSEIITFYYKIDDQERVGSPIATPGTSDDLPATILPGNKILLSSTTKEASIYYTLDGSSPVVNVSEEGIFSAGNEPTKLYDPTIGIEMPEDGKDYFTITAVAVKSGYAQSTEAHFTYSFPPIVPSPYANFASGKVELNTEIFLKNLTEGAVIYYNVTYGEMMPEDPTLSSSVFNESYPFTITQKTTIKAMAVKDNVKSEIVSFTFEPMTRLNAPAASIQSGSVVARGTVLELSAEKGAVIYYTMDGSDPMDSENKAVMSGNSLVLNGEPGGQITIKAYAVAEDKSKSEVVTFTYIFSQNTGGGITASIESGSIVSNGTKVNLISDVTDGDIYYTTDGSSPVSGGKKGTTVEINGTPGSTFTIKAVVIANDEPGTVATFIYKIQERPDKPTASPAGGTLSVATLVTLSAETEKIYYTTDGTEPTKSSTLYAEPILINRATILKAIAVSEEGEISEIATFVYEAALKAASVKSSAEDGKVMEPGEKIYLTTATEGTEIYYSTDGTEPTIDNLDSLLLYSDGYIEIHRDVTIHAVAYRKDLRLSDVQTWSYLVERIPAVEQKEAEEAKKAEEGLRDTDASKLTRQNKREKNQDLRTVYEKQNGISMSYAAEAFSGSVSLESVKEDKNSYTVKKVRGIYGDDITVLETYKVKVKTGASAVQPKDSVEITFPIPKGYEDAVLTVALVKDDSNLKTLETERDEEGLHVKTKNIGNYIIIGSERASAHQQKFPYLVILEAAAGTALTSGVIFYIVQKIKKFKKNK